MAKNPLMERPKTEKDIAALAEIMASAFGMVTADATAWLGRAGHENLRTWRDGRRIAGGLIILPTGQWFGGRSVPMAGIAGVAVAPQHRARGMGTEMMLAAVREMRAAGWALSALYPATVPLYRRAGYELGGGVYEYQLAPRTIVERERDMPIREITRKDMPAVERAYSHRAQRTCGNLERIDYFWRRIREPFNAPPTHGYAVWGQGEIEGYVYFYEKRGDTMDYALRVTDLVVLTPAGRRLLTFFADHRTMSDNVVWCGSPADPLLMTLSEHTYKTRRLIQWMLRILDVEKALSARGYPRGVEAEIRLRVRDDQLPENNDDFVLRVAGGRGRVRRAGRAGGGRPSVRRGRGGHIAIHVRGLAPLYTGYLSPVELAEAGLLEGPRRQIEALAPLFAGPVPWMADMF